MLKAIIFDLDGVIAETESVHLKAFQKTFEKFNLNITQEYHIGLIGFTVKDNIIKIKKDFHLEIDVDEYVKKRNNEYLALLEKDTIAPNPGLNDILNWGKKNKLKLGICSSSKRKMVDIVLKGAFKKMGIEKSIYDFFDTVITADNTKRKKPYPDLYLYAIDKLSMAPFECLVIEDSEVGIRSAKTAGCRVVGLITPYNRKKELVIADKIVDSLKDLLEANFWGWFDKGLKTMKSRGERVDNF